MQLKIRWSGRALFVLCFSLFWFAVSASDGVKIDTTRYGWKVDVGRGALYITPYINNVVEVYFSADGKPVDDPSHAVIQVPQAAPRSLLRLPDGRVVLTSGAMQVVVDGNRLNLSFIYAGDTLLRQAGGFDVRPGLCGVNFYLQQDEQIYGAGERSIPLNRRGYEMPLYNKPNYGYGLGATSLNYSIPVVVSSKKYVLFWDNPQKGVLDVGKTTNNILSWKSIGGTPRYFVMAASDYPALMNTYTQMTGRQSMPPRWALGNLQSRMAYRSQKETDSIVDLMIDKDFPIDAMILDFFWFGDSIIGYVGNLDWYKPAWPDPEGMIKKFKSKGIKTILITEPYVIDSLKNYQDGLKHNIFVTNSMGTAYLDTNFYFGPGSLIDIFKPEARDWFWKRYQKQIDIGVAAWWGDLGEPESHPSDIVHVIGKADEVHNIYGHYWDKMLFEKYAQHYPSTRLFHLQRSGFAGSQRYSAYPWTGDVGRSWSGLQAQLPVLLSMSMNGLGYIHSDAGGFAMGERDDELYTRWLQFAVFTPILRPHGSGVPAEPVYFSTETQDIVRSFMKLRYSLLPYNYSLAWQNSMEGYPLMRPLYYSFSDDKQAVDVNDQYLWGDNLMIAPVLEPGVTVRKVYFPAGEWFEYFTRQKFVGPKWVDMPVSRALIPVFARAGSFIPTTRPVASIDFYRSDNFSVRYYPKGHSEFVQYEDDGLNNNAAATNQFELIRYAGDVTDHLITIQMSSEGTWIGKPGQREMTLEVKLDQTPKMVAINNFPILLLDNSFPGYSIADGFVKIRFVWDGKPVNIKLHLK